MITRSQSSQDHMDGQDPLSNRTIERSQSLHDRMNGQDPQNCYCHVEKSQERP